MDTRDFSKEECAILLCGYINGLLSQLKEKPDPIMEDALRKLGCPERYLSKKAK